MRHFRRRFYFGYLALIALATQLVMSFGHTHAPRTPDANLALACRTFFHPPADQGCPPLNKHSADCAVCWTIAAAGTLVLPVPPSLAPPQQAGEIWQAPLERAPLIAIRASAFDARGPPSSVAA